MRSFIRPFQSLTRGKLAAACTVLGVVLLVGGWLALAPTSLGGSSTYVTTFGNSMEPLLHRGDLALVRRQASYRVGDVVAYRSDLLGTVVLHRIVARDGDRYVFKGDHNTWEDADHPTADHLLGKMVVHLPGVGAHVQQAASPPAVGGLAAVAFVPLMRRDRRRKRAGTEPPGTRFARSPRRPAAWGPIEPRLLVMTAIGVGMIAVAFTRPTSMTVTRDLPFDDQTTFTYTGPAPAGIAAYQSDHVSSGQPVFLNLVDHLDIGVEYAVSSTATVDAAGDLAMRAVLRDSNGWSRPLDMDGSTAFRSTRVTTHGTLDLAAVRTAIADVQMATGIVRDRYQVDVEAEITRTVTHDRATTKGVVVSKLGFVLDDREMHLADSTPGALTTSAGDLLTVTAMQPNRLTLAGRNVPVATLRLAALAFAVIAAALWLEWLIRALLGDEAALIERRYRALLLPVRTAHPAPGPVLDVERMADLARMADQLGSPILRRPDGTFDLVDGATTFRYSISTGT